MRLLPLLAVSVLVFGAACARRLPGSADVAAAEKYVSPGAGRSTANELAKRVLKTYPNMIHDPALDEAAKILAEEYGFTQELPGTLYIQELIWRRGSTSRYLYWHGGSSSGAAGVAHLDSLLAAVLEQDKELSGKVFGLHRTRIAYVMLVAEAPVVIDPLPKVLAPAQTFTLAGKLRDPGETSVLLWGPGDLEPRNVLIKEDGSWEPLQLQAPQTPGRYPVEIATDGARSKRLLLVPLTVGAPPSVDAIDRPPPGGPEAVEAEARLIVARWRELAKRPPIALDPVADERARQNSEAAVDGFTRSYGWSWSGGGPGAWQEALLNLQAPDVGASFAADADLLAVGASRDGDKRWLRVDLLKKRPQQGAEDTAR